MSTNLVMKEKACWRCGGSGTINHDTDRCPGCQGSGLQAHLRPAQELAMVRMQDWVRASGVFAETTAEDVVDYLEEREITDLEHERTRARVQAHLARLERGVEGLLNRLTRYRPTADQPCPSCGGSGVKTEYVDVGGHYETRQSTCTGCGGSGRVQ